MTFFFCVTTRVAVACALLTAGGSILVTEASPAHAAGGGPVILDGMDPGFHGSASGGVPQGAWLYIAKAYSSLMNASSPGSAGAVAVLGPADSTATSNDCGAGAHWASAYNSYTPTFYSTATAIDTFFTQLRAGTVSPAPRIIHIVDTVCSANRLTSAEQAQLVAHASDLANFVGAGGGLLADTEAFSGSNDAWLTALIPTITVGTGGGNTPALTAAGQATLPGISNSDIAVPWHSQFSGNLGGLQILATDGGQNVIIGGASVSLLGSTTVMLSGPSVNTGTLVTVTANVKDSTGAPIAGSTVTFSVTSGPNTGATGTALTDGSGNVAWTYTGGPTTGTDTIRASATVNGNPQSGSTTVTWTTAPAAPTAPIAHISLGANSGPMAATPDGKGYWIVSPSGAVTAYGDARFFGSAIGLPLHQRIVEMQTTPDGNGYWLVASDGGVFTFGNAGFYGSTANQHLNQPVTGIATTPDAHGYWLVASDGGVFTFGNAGFYGSTANQHLNQPVTGIASSPDAHGYWLVASDGGMFTFGNAGFYGSMPAK